MMRALRPERAQPGRRARLDRKRMTAADETLFDLVVRCVPQWYFSAHGPNGYELHLEGNQRHFYSQRPLTPELKLLLEWVNGRLSVWKETLPKVPTPSFVAKRIDRPPGSD